MEVPIAENREKISTFVFLDLETTGLFAEQKRKCRITELSMIAVDRINIQGVGYLPRVLNKVTLCINPVKLISAFSSNITGLYNDSLECQKPFSDETVQLINAFINLHQKPVCLLSHNGNRFDFPLLLSELKRINQSFCNDILCADTLEMFRLMDGLPARHEFSSNGTTPSSINSPGPSVSRDQGELTPKKPIHTPQNQLSPQKRKLNASAEDSNANALPKIIKQDTETLSSNSANNNGIISPRDKVKVALRFNDIKVNEQTSKGGLHAIEGIAGSKCESDEAKTVSVKDAATSNDSDKPMTNFVPGTKVHNVDTGIEGAVKDTVESIPEFSASLEDSDYLQALDDVEIDIGKNAEKLDAMETTKDKSCDVGKSNVASNYLPSYVFSSTGYHVKPASNSDGKNDANSDKETDGAKYNDVTNVLEKTNDAERVISQGKEFGKMSDELKPNTKLDDDETSDSDSVIIVETDHVVIDITKTPDENSEDQNRMNEGIRKETDESKLISDSRATIHSSSESMIERPFTSIRTSSNLAITAIDRSTLSNTLFVKNSGSTIGVKSSTSKPGGSSMKHVSLNTSLPVLSNYGTPGRSNMNFNSNSTKSFTKPTPMNSDSPARLSSNASLAGSGTKSLPSNNGLPASARFQFNSSSNAAPSKVNLNPSSFTPSDSALPARSTISYAKPSPSSTASPSKMSYRLDEIHARKFGARPPISHSAEADCITLLKCVKETPESLKWLDDNAIPLNSVPLIF